jgi:serine/threonine protein kinase
MIGETISHYRIIAPLGRGGMGEVYLAEDTRLERKVAIKFIIEELESDRSSRLRFLTEAKAAAALDHPFVCKVFDADEHDGNPFIVMEYIEGQSLLDKLQ